MNFMISFLLHRCIKGSLLPPVATTGWIFQTSAIGSEDNERNGSSLLNKVSFGQSFALAVPKSCVDSKTLLLTIWSVWSRKDREDDEECLGSTQLSLADKDLFGTSQPIIPCWYNVLNFHFVMGGVNNSKPSSNLNAQSTTTTTRDSAATTNTPGDTNVIGKPVLHTQPSRPIAKPESQMSSRQGTLKEGESSDESTIISSQTSTLTRAIDPELVLNQSNISLKSSSPHGMISQLAGNALRAPCLYNTFSTTPLSNNYNPPAAAQSPIQPASNKGLIKLPNFGASKKGFEVPPSTASSSSISSGPQQGSRQSTPFNTVSDKQTGNADDLQTSKMVAAEENRMRFQNVSTSNKNLQKEMRSPMHRLQEELTNHSTQQPSVADAETNTECVFLNPSAASSNSRGKHPPSSVNTNTGLPVPLNESNSVSSLVRRSQTFSPSAPINKNDYVCKVINTIFQYLHLQHVC